MATTVDIRAALDEILSSIESGGSPEDVEMKLSGGAAGLLAYLADELGRYRGKTISEALAFLFYGLTVQRDGMHMAVVDGEGNVRAILDLIPGD